MKHARRYVPGAGGCRDLSSRRSRGSIVAYALVMITVMVMGVVMTTAVSSTVHTQMAGLETKRDQVYYAAEAGIQRAMYELEYGTWQSTATYPLLSGDVGPCHYMVAATGGGWNTAANIVSIATHGSDTTITCTIEVSFQPKVLVPAINLGSGINENGNLTVDGNALIKGNIDLGGKVAIDGSVIYGGTNNGVSGANFVHQDPATIPAPPKVWYDATGTLTPPGNVVDVTPLVNAANGAKYLSSSSPNTLDFHSTSNGVLYYNGDVSLKNITVYGSGTLVVFGNVDIQNGGFGDSTTPVNIVATGTISTQANFRIYGSLYANGDITHQGQFDVTGTINGQGSMYPTQGNHGAGGATINRAPPPAFDPRGITGAGSFVVTNFMGPSF
jgi:hypothetical protein